MLRVAVGSKALIGVGSTVFGLLGRMESRRLIHLGERIWARSTTALLRLRLDITGVANIEPGGRYIVIALHEGFADAVALLRLPLPLRFLVRDELFEWTALGRYLRATGQIRVDDPATKSSLRSMHRRIEASLASGDSLVVFAQGSILGVEIAFQPGAFHIARRLNVPILPVVITGSHTVWEHPYTPTVRLDQTISVRVLPALTPTSLDAATVRGLERRMKLLALDPSTAPARRFDPDRDGWWDDYRYEIDRDFSELANRLARRRAGSGEGLGGRPVDSATDDFDTPPEGDMAFDVGGSGGWVLVAPRRGRQPLAFDYYVVIAGNTLPGTDRGSIRSLEQVPLDRFRWKVVVSLHSLGSRRFGHHRVSDQGGVG